MNMAKVIEYYIPPNFVQPKFHWIPEEQRGKVIEFHTKAA